jgi:hypothetical protein
MAHRAVAVETELPDTLDDLLLISIIGGWRLRESTQSPENMKVGVSSPPSCAVADPWLLLSTERCVRDEIVGVANQVLEFSPRSSNQWVRTRPTDHTRLSYKPSTIRMAQTSHLSPRFDRK